MRKTIALILCLVTFLTLPAYAADSVTAKPTTSGVALNGGNITCAAYNINGNNYFKLRDLMQALDKEVSWDGADNTIRINTAKPYTPDGSEGKPRGDKNETALPTTSKILLNGAPVSWTAYNIGGNNYFKLRDVLKALDIFVYWSAEYNIVYIDTTKGYVDETPAQPVTPTAEVMADGSGRLSDTPITRKVLDGKDLAREDFSQSANPAVFDGTYTRGAYNAIRQTIVDRDRILSGCDDKGFNPYYHYAHVIPTAESRETLVPILISIGMYSNYSASMEPYVKNVFDYPTYIAVMPRVTPLIDAAEKNVAPLIEQANSLTTAAEKVKLLNNALCDRMTYDITASTGINAVFSGNGKARGECSSFASTFSYLCDRASIPCVILTGENHAWNAVYVDGKWLYVDVSANSKVEGRNSLLLAASSRKTDQYPKDTAFAMELLVPGSTK